jgi:hypothetical protein
MQFVVDGLDGKGQIVRRIFQDGQGDGIAGRSVLGSGVREGERRQGADTRPAQISIQPADKDKPSD